MLSYLENLLSQEDRLRPLPLGTSEFEDFVDRIISKLGTGLEKVPRDDIKFVLTTNITHLKPQECEARDSYFVKTIRAAAAKQVAGAVFQQVKEDQKKRQEAEQQQAEATASQAETSECQPVITPS